MCPTPLATLSFMTTNTETFQFQAEARQVLDLMIHSLYTQMEIFLRELISNASDALDRLRFEALSRPELIGPDEKLEIWIESDPNARTLTISDNGIGMSREEVVANIGTIAKSGTRELLESLRDKPSETLTTLIGQFGVGFYSAFVAADRVTLLTRRAGEEKAVQWESSGDGTFTVTEASKFTRGTSVTLHLKKFEEDAEVDDFTEKRVIEGIVKRYSDFVSYPIIYKSHDTKEPDRTLNSMKPIWTRPRSEVKDDEYKEFYKHISHDWNEPMETWSFRAEGRSEYQALLFVPSQAPFDLFYATGNFGLHLYVRRVLKEGIMDFENKEKLTGLYLFESSHDPGKLTTLKDYVARMNTDQSAIYFLTGPSRRAVENSPHLEAFREKRYEVLFLVDPVDEMLVQWLPEFEGKQLKSV